MVHTPRKRSLALLATLAGAVVLAVGPAQATPGQLDASFGSGGKVTTSIGSGSSAGALALQPDGRIVVAGYGIRGTKSDFALARYNANGSLDTAFGSGGKVTTAIGSSDDFARALVLQPDGKAVVAGLSQNGTEDEFALARYNHNGSLDTSFGPGGKVRTAIGSDSDGANALALQPDGKLVAAGYSWNGSKDDFALARYNPDGSLDTGFNGTGTVTTAIGSHRSEANAIALQPDGKIVAAGSGYNHNGSKVDFALARYNPDGSLDTSFNGTGTVTTAIGPHTDHAEALALQPDGKIVAAGYSLKDSKYDFALARYDPDGSLDTSFNGTGTVTTAISGGGDFAAGVAIQPDGKIVAVGARRNRRITPAHRYNFALARYNRDGSLDSGFGSGGKVATSFLGSDDSDASAVTLQPDGKIVVAGEAYTGSNYEFALARYLGGTLQCVVPKVKGKRLTAAKRSIRRHHCTLGRVRRTYSSSVKKGRVISQKPKPGVECPAGSKVKLKVSKGELG